MKAEDEAPDKVADEVEPLPGPFRPFRQLASTTG